MDAADMLSRVTIHALHCPEFRQAWERAVSDASAQAAAGDGFYSCDVPVPAGMDRTGVLSAFQLAVEGAVERRLRS